MQDAVTSVGQGRVLSAPSPSSLPPWGEGMPGQALSGPHSCCYFRYGRKWALEDSGSSEPSGTSRNVCDLPGALAAVQPSQEGRGKSAAETLSGFADKRGALPSPWGPGRPRAPGGEAGSSHCPGGRDPHMGSTPEPPSWTVSSTLSAHTRGRSAVLSCGSLQMTLTGLSFAPAETRLENPGLTFVRSCLRAEQFCADGSSPTQLGPGGSESLKDTRSA